MKTLLQYFVAPLTAAALALIGNYYLVQKPMLNKDYTQIGTEILLNKDAPAHLHRYATDLVAANSPIALPDAEKHKELERLFNNIPYRGYEHGKTFRDITAEYIALVGWLSSVRALCPECINPELAQEKVEGVKAEMRQLRGQ